MGKRKGNEGICGFLIVNSIIFMAIGSIIVCPWMIFVSLIVFLVSCCGVCNHYFKKMDDSGWPTDWSDYV